MQFSRSFILAIALITAVPATFQAHEPGCADTSAIKKIAGSGKISLGTAAAVILFAALYIRLVTKPTAKQRVDRTWKEYFTKLLSLLNVTEIATPEYWELFDQLIVGDQFKLRDKSTREKDENGVIITYKEKAPKAFPSGMMGYFDSYILQTFKNLFENLNNLKSCKGFFESISCE